MKFFIALLIMAFSIGSFAQDDLNVMKAKATLQIDKKMSNLRTSKDCVNNASSIDKLKACKYDMQEGMHMQKMDMMKDKKKEMED